MPINVRRPPSNVQVERLKGGGRTSERVFQPPDIRLSFGKVSENMPRITLPHRAVVDPLPALVDDRFRLLKQCPVCDDWNDEEVFDRRLDQAQRRIRRLDERIIRTVATSTPGLLAQLRLLAAFYEESANGAGRRGSLLIQVIAQGVVQLAEGSPQPTNSPRLEIIGVWPDRLT